MERISLTPRRDWQKAVESLGLIWHTVADRPYWNEAACYRFTSRQIDEIEAATAELYRISMAAAQYVIDKKLYNKFGIPEFIVPLIERTWSEEPPALNHSRFDLAYDGVNPPKMLEYNCDTPTSLLEAAVIQWDWKESVFPREDQFNSLHDKLLAKWKDIRPWLRSGAVHFTHVNDPSGEDAITVSYLRDLAAQAGLETIGIFARDIGWSSLTGRLVDLEAHPINTLFHLYPWEWLLHEEFGQHIPGSAETMHWIEPVWKMLLSNKAILVVLWELFPDHPNLLPCYFKSSGTDYVRKPLLGREGANITIVRDGRTLEETPGHYGAGEYVYQKLFPPRNFEGRYPVLGSWIVDGEPAGMGIREDGLITGNTAQFVPHVFA